MRQNLEEFEDRARKNLDAMVLRTDVPLEVDFAAATWGDVNTEEVQRLFGVLEFNSLYERLREILGDALPADESSKSVLEAEPLTMASVPECREMLASLLESPDPVSLGWATDVDGGLVALTFVCEANLGEVLVLGPNFLEQEEVLGLVSQLLGDEEAGFDTHNAKGLGRAMRRLGVGIEGLRVDTAIAAYLLDPSSGRYAIDDLLLKYQRVELVLSLIHI